MRIHVTGQVFAHASSASMGPHLLLVRSTFPHTRTCLLSTHLLNTHMRAHWDTLSDSPAPTCTHTHTHTCIHTWTLPHAHAHTHAHTRTQRHTHTHSHTHADPHAYPHARRPTPTCIPHTHMDGAARIPLTHAHPHARTPTRTHAHTHAYLTHARTPSPVVSSCARNVFCCTSVCRPFPPDAAPTPPGGAPLGARGRCLGRTGAGGGGTRNLPGEERKNWLLFSFQRTTHTHAQPAHTQPANTHAHLPPRPHPNPPTHSPSD